MALVVKNRLQFVVKEFSVVSHEDRLPRGDWFRFANAGHFLSTLALSCDKDGNNVCFFSDEAVVMGSDVAVKLDVHMYCYVVRSSDNKKCFHVDSLKLNAVAAPPAEYFGRSLPIVDPMLDVECLPTFKLDSNFAKTSLTLRDSWDADHCVAYMELFAACGHEKPWQVTILKSGADIAQFRHILSTFQNKKRPECSLSRVVCSADDKKLFSNIDAALKEINMTAAIEKGTVAKRIDLAQGAQMGLLQCEIEVITDTGKPAWEIWPLNGPGELHSVLGTGDRVRVAVLDSGIDAAHPDIRRQLRGFKSFVLHDDDAWLDSNGHGTLCGSILAAVAPGCDLFVAKVLPSERTQPSDVDDLCNAIYWAVDDVACKVISMSVGTTVYCTQLRTAINHAIESGVIVICAAANYGRLNQSNIAYPAAFGNVICVGSHDENGQVSRFSSVGREVDFLAPGETILAARACTGGRIGVRGTSMAVPFAAGLASLLVESVRQLGNSYNIDNELARILMRTLCSSPGQHNDARGYGLLKPMAQLGPNGVEYVLNHLRQAAGDTSELSAMILANDDVRTVANLAKCTAPSFANPGTDRRVHYFVSAALFRHCRGQYCAHASALIDKIVLVLAGNMQHDNTNCVVCNGAVESVKSIETCDRNLLNHFLMHAKLNGKRTGNIAVGQCPWDQVVRALLFGNQGRGDSLGCWLSPGDNKMFYSWPKWCDCAGAKKRNLGLVPGELPCPFWSHAAVEFATSRIPLALRCRAPAIDEKVLLLHHPLVCEVNPNPNMKRSGVSHTCFRPSHLLCGNSAMNGMHRSMNKDAMSLIPNDKRTIDESRTLADRRKWSKS